jgi:formylglycine-generating enzyme required for sulfatase activity
MMVEIPAGTFQMGDDSKSAAVEEGPVHSVNVPAFAIGQFEITFDQFDAFAKVTHRDLPNDEGWGRGARPVINVNWQDAIAYTAWLSEETGKAYRLPTEADWEYAARAGTKGATSWGSRQSKQCTFANGADITAQQEELAWTIAPCDDGYYRTAPVGSFKSNPFGLHDMLGNVLEWTADCWNDNYEGAPTDGSAWTTGQCDRRVLRGGAWNNSPAFLRSAKRETNAITSRLRLHGFRVARDI